MPFQFPCPHCRTPVPYEEEDRGLELYCPSCAKAVVAPGDAAVPQAVAAVETQATAGASAASTGAASARASRVFGAARPEEQPLGEVTCLCGKANPYYLSQVGTKIYCESCGAELQVGASFDRRAGRAATAEAEMPQREAPKVRRRWLRSPWTLASAIVAVGITSAVGYVTYQRRQQAAGPLALGILEFEPRRAALPREFRPEDLGLPLIDDLLKSEDPFQALDQVYAWDQGLRWHRVPENDERAVRLREVAEEILRSREAKMSAMIAELAEAPVPQAALEQADAWGRTLDTFQVPSDDRRQLELAEITLQLIEKADPITPEMIAALRSRSDTAAALVQAQLWLQTLKDRKLPESDPRYAQLEEVVAELTKKLVPDPAEVSRWVADFRGHVQQLHDKLLEKDLSGARAACDAAERMLKEHPDELAHQSRRFLGLKSRLKQMELEKEGLARINLLLKQAEEAGASGEADRFGAALEARCELKFLALMTPLTKDQAEQISQRLVKLTRISPENPEPPLRMLAARRAVADVQKLAGDKVAKNYALRKVEDVLPGLPEPSVRPLFELVQTELEAWRKSPVAKGTPSTEAGLEWLRRDYLERALELYGDADSRKLLAVCEEFHHSLNDQQRASLPGYQRMLDLLFQVLEFQITRGLHGSEESPAESLRALAEARKVLSQATLFQGDARWKALDGALRQFANPLGKDALRRAQALAERDNLDEALEILKPAVELAGPEVAVRAKELESEWREEIRRRADRKAEAELWQQIDQALKQKGKESQAWHLLTEFQARYPQSAQREAALAAQARIRAAVDAQFSVQVRQFVNLLEQNKWREAKDLLEVLKSAAQSDEQRAKLGDARKRWSDAGKGLEQEFQLLSPTARALAGEASFQEVYRVCSQLLLFNPDHGDAHALLAKAKERGGRLARGLLDQAERYKKRPDSYRDLLERAARLDPYGPHGLRARQLLAESQAVPPSGTDKGTPGNM